MVKLKLRQRQNRYEITENRFDKAKNELQKKRDLERLQRKKELLLTSQKKNSKINDNNRKHESVSKGNFLWNRKSNALKLSNALLWNDITLLPETIEEEDLYGQQLGECKKPIFPCFNFDEYGNLIPQPIPTPPRIPTPPPEPEPWRWSHYALSEYKTGGSNSYKYTVIRLWTGDMYFFFQLWLVQTYILEKFILKYQRIFMNKMLMDWKRFTKVESRIRLALRKRHLYLYKKYMEGIRLFMVMSKCCRSMLTCKGHKYLRHGMIKWKYATNFRKRYEIISNKGRCRFEKRYLILLKNYIRKCYNVRIRAQNNLLELKAFVHKFIKAWRIQTLHFKQLRRSIYSTMYQVKRKHFTDWNEYLRKQRLLNNVKKARFRLRPKPLQTLSDWTILQPAFIDIKMLKSITSIKSETQKNWFKMKKEISQRQAKIHA